jgi:hypothetical protein
LSDDLTDIGVHVPLLQAYCSLLDALAATAGTEAVGRAAALARSALSRFEIQPPVALKALLGLLLSRARPPEQSAAAAADVVEALVHPKASAQDDADGDAIGAADEIDEVDETRGGSEGTLQRDGVVLGDGAVASVRGSGSGAEGVGSALSASAPAAAAVRLRLCASVATRTASLHLALAHFKSILDDEPSSTAARLLPVLPSIRRALEALFTPSRSSVEREVTGAAAVVSRVILLMAQLLGAVIKQAAAAKAAQRAPTPGSSEILGDPRRSSVDLRAPTPGSSPAQRRLVALDTASATTTLVAATSAPTTTPKPEAASARGGANGPSVDAPSLQHPLELLRASIPAWVECVPLTRTYGSWLRRASASWSAPNRRRVPAALYACERATLALLDALGTPAGASLVRADVPTAALLQSIQHDWAVSSNGKAMAAAGRLPANGHGPGRVVSVTGDTEDDGGTGREVDDEDGDKEEQHEETVELLQPRAASRRRLRSRNPFIDSELGRGGGGDDSYADLEDFIVCKRGRQY